MRVLTRIWNAFVYGLFNIIALIVFPVAAMVYIIANEITVWDAVDDLQKRLYIDS